MRIYRTTDNDYVTLVAHDSALLGDENFEYFGAFEYSISQDEDTGEWLLNIFDLAEWEGLDVDILSGIDKSAVSTLVKASRGEAEFEEIKDSDYYDRIKRFTAVLEDEVLTKAIVAEYRYAERD